MSRDEWIDTAWEKAVEKVGRTSRRVGSTFPHFSVDGQWDNGHAFWTKGFWPGILWLIVRESGDARLKEIAVGCEEQLDSVLEGFYDLHHDNGFVWSLASVARYKIDGNEDSKRRALTAASHLAGRFNLKGHFIRAWNDKQSSGKSNSGWAIIDCTMNLPLLYWASETTGDPRFRHIAKAHADTVIEHFIRGDGSVNHIVSYDPETGEKIEVLSGQGLSPESAWARGASWAIHGLALSYRYTKEKRYIDAAKRAAHYYISALPKDGIPYWDLRAPADPGTARDSTAAACAASGLLEIARWVDTAESRAYFDWAKKMIESLYENYGAWEIEEEALLVKGTSNHPAGTGVEVPLIYGDYFFMEALAKLRGNSEVFW